MLLKDWFNHNPDPGRLSRRMRAALVVAFLCAGAMILLNETTYTQTAHALHSIRLSHELRTTVNDAMRELAMAESAQRGYVLTGDAAYLEPYRDSKEKLVAYMPMLDATALADASIQEQARELAKILAQKIGEMDLTVRLREQGKIDAVNFVVSTNVGLGQMREARALADKLFGISATRVEQERREVFRLLNVTRFGLAAGILAALFAFVLYTQQARLLQRAEEDSKRALEVERDALESQVQERTARLTELASYLQQAVEDERAHLARELHDELGALLTAAKLDVARLKSRIPPDEAAQLERLKHLTESLNQGIALKRRIIEDLRPSSLSNLGLVASLDILTREFGERSRMLVETSLEPVDLDPNRELTIYRMVQESLTNIGKYSQATEVGVTLKNYVYHAEVSVQDNGIGFDLRRLPQSSHGLVGMRHRIEAAGGRLDVRSTPGQGTRLTATIPRAQAKPQAEMAKSMDEMSVSVAAYPDPAEQPTAPTAAG